ncbi:RAVE protein 1 C terminal-domain-containing protein [Pisolithus marmoratus]|nr:RAVE protein 1 C terminal-domain-containing protein [Pisolithus marmoratus]
MLDLTRAFTGCPVGPLKYLVLPHTTLIAYPSADAVIVLNASTLALVRVLALREVFPGTRQAVSCLVVDPALKVIVVSTGTRIAAWSLSGVQSNTFRVHSSLILPDGDPVTALDCRAGLLAIGSQKGLSVFTLILENDLLTWSQKWFTVAFTPRSVAFSPTLAYIAITTLDATQVRVYSTASGVENQVISHPRPVSDVIWRCSSTSRGDDPVLFTVTSDSVLRIFLPVVDSPHRLQLHLAIDPSSSLTPSNTLGISSYSASKIIWLDKEIIGPVIKTLLEGSPVGGRNAEMEKLREIDEEKSDLFVRVFEDGSLVLSAVANIDRKPPTLLRHFIVSRSPPGAIYPLPSNIYILPRVELTMLTLVTSPPLRTFEVLASSLLSGRADSFQLCAAGPDKLPLQDSKISHFVRTPAGRGVAIVREGGGETWMVADSGANLFQVDSWSSADHVVVLDGGKLIATYSADDSKLLLHSSPPSSEHESIIGVTDEMSILHIHISTTACPTLVLHSCEALPLPKRPKLILPVDPMAWSGTAVSVYDHLLSISDDGELRFWDLEHNKNSGWRCTGRVRTGRSKFTNARCSSAKKSVLVTRDADGQELTIWDSNESEFASGLEHRRIFSAAEPIHDLDWTSTPDNQSILAVGFTHHVELLCQQRKTYFDDDPAWVIYCKVEIGNFTPFPISDSIWLANGSFLVGAGHQMFLFSQVPSPRDTSECSLFESVARSSGPLDDYHPQMLLQCLLWGKISLVKQIIVRMAQIFRTSNEFHWKPLPIEEYYGKEWTIRRAKPYDFLVGSTNQGKSSEGQGFSHALVGSLIERLETYPLSHLTPNEHAHLIVLIQTTLEIDEQRRALDANGFRYVLSMRSFYILNRRIASDPNSPQSGGDIARKTGWRDRLRYRDMIWAFHSESQDILLNESVAACNGKMLWSDARALGVFIWLNSVDVMKSHMETIARNQYMCGELRDPTACSLFYFALGKFKLVHGLWRQAVWHKEQAIMLKFLSNDFTTPRWKTAALKNAYVLLSKQRFEYAVAFFLLGGSLKDAVNVCIKQLSDFQLAIALARVVEQGNDGPVFQGILKNTVLPMAVGGGNKWLCSWAFWMLRRRDLSVRVLLTPLQDIVNAFGINVKDVGEPYFDDPSLALLFSQLRSKTLQTATGTSEISAKSEFNFVLQVARVFCRMGCHALALDLVRSWSFERPTALSAVDLKSPPSPQISRRSLTTDPFLLRRTSSIMIDMDVDSRTPSGQNTPKAQSTVREEEPDRLARKAGLGSLMKSAKHDIQVPEFDINAFF